MFVGRGFIPSRHQGKETASRGVKRAEAGRTRAGTSPAPTISGIVGARPASARVRPCPCPPLPCCTAHRSPATYPLAHELAAVYENNLAGDKRSGRRGQEKGGVQNILRCTPAFHGDRRDGLLMSSVRQSA